MVYLLQGRAEEQPGIHSAHGHCVVQDTTSETIRHLECLAGPGYANEEPSCCCSGRVVPNTQSALVNSVGKMATGGGGDEE